MPNWVFNTVTVSGDKTELDRMVAQLNQPVTKNFPDTNYDKEKQEWAETPAVQVLNAPVFSFWNVVAPTDLDSYYGKEKAKVDLDNFAQTFFDAVKTDDSWYYWNLRNWGTKWDIAVADDQSYASTSMEIADNGDVVYRFETAWSPVQEVLTTLSEQFPTLEFGYYYEEEQGWGGEAIIQNGEYTETNEWDIPSSHADNVALDKECNCEFEEDPIYWYSDCPVDTEKYELIDGEWEEKTLDSTETLV